MPTQWPAYLDASPSDQSCDLDNKLVRAPFNIFFSQSATHLIGSWILLSKLKLFKFLDYSYYSKECYCYSHAGGILPCFRNLKCYYVCCLRRV